KGVALHGSDADRKGLWCKLEALNLPTDLSNQDSHVIGSWNRQQLKLDASNQSVLGSDSQNQSMSKLRVLRACGNDGSCSRTGFNRDAFVASIEDQRLGQCVDSVLKVYRHVRVSRGHGLIDDVLQFSDLLWRDLDAAAIAVITRGELRKVVE